MDLVIVEVEQQIHVHHEAVQGASDAARRPDVHHLHQVLVHELKQTQFIFLILCALLIFSGFASGLAAMIENASYASVAQSVHV